MDGRRIHRVKRFKLLCRGCKRINKKIDVLFCQFCGISALVKVSVYINDNGEVTYFKNPRRKINLKGTKYQIAKPTGSHTAKKVVLREDELLQGQKKMLFEK